MRTTAMGAFIVATLVPTAAIQAQRQQFDFSGCNLHGTCATASLFYESMTREAIFIVADIRWAADAPGAVVPQSIGSAHVAGIFRTWEGPTTCAYPATPPILRCTAGWGPVFPIFLAPAFRPTTLHIGIGYGRDDAGFPVSTAALTLTAVPEPATLALLATGLLALGGVAARGGRRRTA